MNYKSNSSFLVNEATFLSLTGSPVFFATIPRNSLTMVWAAFPISPGVIISPVKRPLQFLTASGFKSRKILCFIIVVCYNKWFQNAYCWFDIVNITGVFFG